jgi:DnaK suppressor protein
MNATITKKSAKNSAAATVKKKATAKPAAKPKAKPAVRATGKTTAKPAKKAAAKVNSPLKTAAKPATKVAAIAKKSAKSPTQSAAKPAKTASKKAAVKTAAQPIAKKAAPIAQKISKVTADKGSAIRKPTDTTNAKTQRVASHVVQNVAIAIPNVDTKVTQPIAASSMTHASVALTGKIESTEVSKVSKVATNTIKPSTNGALLTEEEILKMSDKDYMNEAQLAFFKARLQQLEIELLKNAGETTEHLRETVLVPDPADRATIEEEHALELRTRDRERKLLKKVQQSLASIENGEYGWCEETGEPIGIPRLLARPTATLSLEAQQRRELKQKLYGD